MENRTRTPEPALSVAAVAKALGLSKRSIWNHIHAGRIGAFRIGGVWRVPAAELRRVMNTTEEAA